MKNSQKDVNSLVIGNTSQLSYYFPKEYQKISSRNLDIEDIKKNKYDRIYICFAEQRTFLNESLDFFLETNYHYTLKVIDELIDFCSTIIVYSTSELWNNYDKCVSVSDPFSYNETPYIKSKEILVNHIKINRKKYENVIIVYPFNFNSVYRKSGFLFGKIYDSIINDKKITIGDVNFYRDIIHPKIIVDESIKANKDILVGSGELINVKELIKDLYTNCGKNFEDYISFEESNNLKNKRNSYFSCKKYSNYNDLIKLSIKDLYEYKIS